MKALVTGGAGFIGHHLVNLLLSEGHEVYVWDNLSTGKLDRLPNSVKFTQLDLTTDELPNIKVDWIFHLAAPVSVQESIENPEKYKLGCYETTRRLLDWSILNEISDFVLASTAAVYGDPTEVPLLETSIINPMSPYAEWKFKAEGLLELSKLNTTALRLFNVFGEGQHDSGSYAPAVALFLKQYKSGSPITVTGDGLQTRDYIYVKDVVNAFYLSVKNPSPNFRRMNVGTGNETTILSIAESFNSEIKYIPARNEPRRSCADSTLIRKNLNWQPTMDIVSWIRL